MLQAQLRGQLELFKVERRKRSFVERSERSLLIQTTKNHSNELEPNQCCRRVGAQVARPFAVGTRVPAKHSVETQNTFSHNIRRK